jgi:XTP/dITP diphosphohydrolase
MKNTENKPPLAAPDLKRAEKLAAFDRLLTIMDELRENCPWDKKQTFDTLRHLTIEEVHELADAIIESNLNEIKKELGDLALHIAFYARLGSEQNAFDMTDVLHSVCDKLIERHPHIYGNVQADNEEQVKKNWEQIKLKEGNKSVLGGVPRSLPSLIKAMRIQEKARGVGFDWENAEQVWEKVKEEIQEFEAEKDIEKATDELGDVLFALINYARFRGINPDEALERTNKKFIYRFQYIEKALANEGKKLGEVSLEEMEKHWQDAKHN